MTATWRSREELVHQIVTLKRDRMSKRAIARALGVSRNTVKAVLAAQAAQRDAEHSAVPAPPTRAPRPKKSGGPPPRSTFDQLRLGPRRGRRGPPASTTLVASMPARTLSCGQTLSGSPSRVIAAHPCLYATATDSRSPRPP